MLLIDTEYLHKLSVGCKNFSLLDLGRSLQSTRCKHWLQLLRKCQQNTEFVLNYHHKKNLEDMGNTLYSS